MELFVHRLQLFVRGLKLLVRRLQLFVRGLKLLVRRFQLLNGRLEFLVGRLQLPFRAFELPLQRTVVGHIDEGQDRARDLTVLREQRRDLNVDDALDARRGRPLDTANCLWPALRVHAVDQRAKLQRSVRELEILERSAEVFERETEHRAGLPVGEYEGTALVDYELAELTHLETGVTEYPMAPVRQVPGMLERHEWHPVGPEWFPCLGEDAVLQRDRGEEGGPSEEHFRAPQEEKTGVIECEAELSQDSSLRLRVEIHQRVPAHEEVDPRDRRAVYQVVMTEDDRATEVLPKIE